MSRAIIGLVALAWVGIWIASPAKAGAGGGLALELELVVEGLQYPLAVTDADDGSGRLFIAEQTGRIRIWDGTELLSTPFLDLSSQIVCCSELGLLGLAFHPDYASNGFFYVGYTEVPEEAGVDWRTVISRFSVSGDPDVADPGSELVLLTVDQPFDNHNNGQLAFGPDGYLYAGFGDGGSGGDPGNRAQNLGQLLGKILRIDVDDPDPPLPYGIPPDNPFVVNLGARDEIWAYGVRNPWRFSFDRRDGDLFIGDVGQLQIEEVDYQPASSPGGENYGWRRMEGSSCFNPPTDCNPDGTLILPILEYDHDDGCAVTGGFRYRGALHPRLRGVYLYGDYCAGTIWGTVPTCDGSWTSSPLDQAGFLISSFGEDSGGEVYAVRRSFSNGRVYRVGLAPGAGGPVLEPSPTGFDFGPVELGVEATLPMSLTNANLGPEALTLDTIATSDPAFTLDLGAGANPCGPAPICLGPGEGCTLEVAFSSAEEGTFSASLDFDGNFDPVPVPLEALAYSACPHPTTVPVSEVIVDEQTFIACAEVIVQAGTEVLGGGDATFLAGVRVTIENGLTVEDGGVASVGVDPLLTPVNR